MDVFELCLCIGFVLFVMVKCIFCDEIVLNMVFIVVYFVFGCWNEDYEVIDECCVLCVLGDWCLEYLVDCIFGMFSDGEQKCVQIV